MENMDLYNVANNIYSVYISCFKGKIFSYIVGNNVYLMY